MRMRKESKCGTLIFPNSSRVRQRMLEVSEEIEAMIYTCLLAPLEAIGSDSMRTWLRTLKEKGDTVFDILLQGASI